MRSSALSHWVTSALALMRVGIYLWGVHAGRKSHFQPHTQTHLHRWERVHVNDATSRQNHTLNWKSIHTHTRMQWHVYTRYPDTVSIRPDWFNCTLTALSTGGKESKMHRGHTRDLACSVYAHVPSRAEGPPTQLMSSVKRGEDATTTCRTDYTPSDFPAGSL